MPPDLRRAAAPGAGAEGGAEIELPGRIKSKATPTVSSWADKIRPHLVGAVENILHAGRKLIAAKADLPHGQFGPLLDELGLSRQMANRFMRVAANPVLTNRPPVGGLPAAVSVLDILAQLDDDDLAAAIESGEVTATTTRVEAKALVSTPTESGDESVDAAIIDLPTKTIVGTDGKRYPKRDPYHKGKRHIRGPKVVANQIEMFYGLAESLPTTSPLIDWREIATDQLDEFVAAATAATISLTKVKRAAERERSRRGPT